MRATNIDSIVGEAGRRRSGGGDGEYSLRAVLVARVDDRACELHEVIVNGVSKTESVTS